LGLFHIQAGDVLPGKKDLKDIAPDLVEGSSDKIQQRGRPSFGQYGGILIIFEVDGYLLPPWMLRKDLCSIRVIRNVKIGEQDETDICCQQFHYPLHCRWLP
jgi:hypothetical protein